MKMITTLAALCAATLTAAPALAQEAAAPRAVTVSYDDLNLRSEDGRAALDGRIRTAIRQVCGSASLADLRGQNRVADCRAERASRVSLQRDRAQRRALQSFITIAIRR